MGSMTFDRETNGNSEMTKRFSFDSSADLAISRPLGLEITSMEFRRTRESETHIYMDVFGHGMGSDPTPKYLVGYLIQEKASARLARMR